MRNSKQPKSILVVEGDPQEESLIVQALQQCGVEHQLQVVSNGARALDVLFNQEEKITEDLPDPPSLVLLNLNLPKISGLEVLQQIRAYKYTKLIPVVVFNSSTNHREIRECYICGANSYVQKPVEPEKFTEAVIAITRYWLSQNTSAYDAV